MRATTRCRSRSWPTWNTTSIRRSRRSPRWSRSPAWRWRCCSNGCSGCARRSRVSGMASVVLAAVGKRYGTALALDDVALEVASGEFVTLLGPSGCGKSTTLRAVAGLAAIDSGRVLINGRDVTALPTAKRNIGMAFHNLALFPHMTVAQNIAFGLRMRRLPTAEQRERVARALDLVRLDGLAARSPH